MTRPARTTHECPKNGCTRQVASSMLACRSHWYQVSKPTRDLVWATYGIDPDAHAEAITQAMDEMNAR